jgi:hypothetical protein
MNIQLSDIGHVIQLAIAPVFLLAGVGTMLVVLTNRLARLIDRTRVLQDRRQTCSKEEFLAELTSLMQRSYLINFAITATTSCGLLVCLVIAMLFLDDITNLPLGRYIAACFVLAMVALIAGFVYFLREIIICCSFMRMQQLKALASSAADAP